MGKESVTGCESAERFKVCARYVFCFECGFHGPRAKAQGPCCTSEAPNVYEVLVVDTVNKVMRVGKV
jgi:hypothetical protein